MVARFGKLFEEGLQKISEGLQKPRSQRRAHKLLERMGRLKQKSRGAGQHYTVNLAVDESGKTATGLTWEKKPVEAGDGDTSGGVLPAQQRARLG